MAQVYSVNAVGYVNTSVPGNFKLAILANPLNGTNNSLNTIMPLPDGSDGVTIYRFDVPSQSYRDGIQFVTGFGWFSPTDDNPTIAPGEGFWVQNPLASTLNVTFVGEVAQGSLSNPLPGAFNLKLASSQVPQSARLGTPSTPGSLEFPAADGDTVYQWDVAAQNYKDAYQYVGGFGWFSPSDDTAFPDGPMINVATGFWIQKPGAATPWTRTFSVN
jgi:hypothetical protein